MTPNLQQQGVGGGQGGVIQRPFMTHPVGQQGPFPFPPGQFPPHIQTAMQNHLQMLGQQMGAQIAMHGNRQIPHGQPNPIQPHNSHHHHSATFQQVVAQQQQARAAAGLQGLADQTAAQSVNNNSDTSRQGAAGPTLPSNPIMMPGPPPNTNTVIQEHQGPNNESWRMVIQSTSTVTGINPAMQRVPLPVNLGNQSSPRSSPQPAMQGFPPPTEPHLHTLPAQGPPRAPNQVQIRMLEREMAAMRTALTLNTAPAPSVFETARNTLRNIENIHEIPALEAQLRTQLETLSTEADRVRANTSALHQMALNQSTQQITPQTLSVQSSSQDSTTSSVYILSSPTGPQALLVSPSGTFSTSWFSHPSANTSLPLISLNNTHPTNSHPLPNTNDAAGNPQPRIVHANGPQAQQQHQQQQPNEVRDLLRLLLPLGGHIWLLIRLFGFVYFFTAGGSSRRAFFLGGIAFLVFVAQTGVFRPVVRAVWDPLRRHVEGLVAGNDQHPVQQPPPPAVGDAENTRSRNREPTPQEAAARLLQERERQNRGAVREYLRSIERAVALFVGSLVPGFGERHIAARDAAEAVRQAEAREREEAARRATEVAEAPRAENENGDNGGVDQHSNGQGSQATGQSAQAPTVEV